jgi:hypothetical protein
VDNLSGEDVLGVDVVEKRTAPLALLFHMRPRTSCAPEPMLSAKTRISLSKRVFEAPSVIASMVVAELA